ncbi:MAG TPA: IclR family transcriptional regulator [Egibacteraceae bacterium]|nr:IclR family transcriptional regulator [Egibacteraceae bacterium]
MGEDGRGGVQAVDRALEVLEMLAADDRPKGVSELARGTGLPAPTIHRLLGTLAARGYVRRDDTLRKYVHGTALIRLAARAWDLLGTGARPYLSELTAASGETANLAVLDDIHVVYIAQVESTHRMRMFTEVGNRVLPHAAAVGKVLLAHQPRADADRIVERTGLPRLTGNTITNLDRLHAELDRVAAAGHAVDEEEAEVGVRCLAVPVPGPDGVAAAISVSGPAGRLSTDQCDELLPVMHGTARRIAADLFGVAG